ncbi:MAG: hypothetical protein WAM97_21965 [Acidimicrobiales bacterium]
METIAIDWSGAKDCRRTLWLDRARDGVLLELRSGFTRDSVIRYLIEHPQSDDGMVVGLDFSFSLPDWFLQEHRLRSARDLWLLVAEQGEQWLEDCEPPFWGRPGKPKPKDRWLFRRTEQAFDSVSGINPKSTFQIGGAGSVGTSSMRGMPHLLTLQDAGFAIWPFDPPRMPLVLEIYPRFMTGPVIKSSPVERQKYIEAVPQGAIPSELAKLAVTCEDAFDAAISAIVMSEHAGELTTIQAVEDATSLLEGRVWAPKNLARQMTDW